MEAMGQRGSRGKNYPAAPEMQRTFEAGNGKEEMGPPRYLGGYGIHGKFPVPIGPALGP